ncbi:F-box protein [Spatholobus suberectus]|nr:F-box protein [Spatholobus suberectus]
MVVAITYCKIGDVKALGCCCVVSCCFHSLVSQVENVVVGVDCLSEEIAFLAWVNAYFELHQLPKKNPGSTSTSHTIMSPCSVLRKSYLPDTDRCSAPESSFRYAQPHIPAFASMHIHIDASLVSLPIHV